MAENTLQLWQIQLMSRMVSSYQLILSIVVLRSLHLIILTSKSKIIKDERTLHDTTQYYISTQILYWKRG